MKQVKKYSFALFLGLFLIVPAQADYEDDLCIAFADGTYQVAVGRDKGVDLFEMRNRIIKAFKEPFVRQGMLRISEVVYTKPWHPPEMEANKILDMCRDKVKELSSSKTIL